MHEANRGRRLLRRPSIFTAAALIAATGFSMVPATTAAAAPPPASLCGAYASAQFGPNVCVFTPRGDSARHLSKRSSTTSQPSRSPYQPSSTDNGYALLFEPGTYGSATTPLVFQVGYYTEVAGLGAVPQDTVINGQIEVFPNAGSTALSSHQLLGQLYGELLAVDVQPHLNVMDSANNYVPQPITQLPPIGDSSDCYGGSTDMWSVSQATPVRSVIINGTSTSSVLLPNGLRQQRLRQR